jgi:hypothetical protein
VIRVYDEAGNVIEAHKQAGDFRESQKVAPARFHASATFTIAIVFKHSEHSTLRNPPLSYLVHVGEFEWQFEYM